MNARALFEQVITRGWPRSFDTNIKIATSKPSKSWKSASQEHIPPVCGLINFFHNSLYISHYLLHNVTYI